MQATVYRYDPTSGSGAVLTDNGVVIPFELDALELSGLRHLRPGQRLTVERADGATGPITQLTLGTIGAALRADPPL